MKKSLYITLLAIPVLVSSCFKTEDYGPVPVITFDEFIATGDSAKLIFDFTDGEGDIGLGDDQTDAPYNFGSKYYYNVYVEYLEKDDTEGFKYMLDLEGDTIAFPIRIHPILDLDESKSIKGKIEVALTPLYYHPTSTQSDTIKFRIQLIDRELHESNWIETGEIIR
jgi:hypothetical protein